MLLYYDPLFLEHHTGVHPERPERLVAIAKQLSESGLAQQCQQPEWRVVSDERIGRVHDAAYLEELQAYALAGGGRIEADTVVSRQSAVVARRAAGAVCDAVERVVRGDDRRALCVVRPPGHHAVRRGAMGFCLLNNIAIAARVALAELAVERVLVVDWDVHHGNGTQDAFWDDGQVGFLSIHRWPFYPGTGADDETGTGPGLGMTVNLPIEFGTPRREYFAQFRRALDAFAAHVKPQLVLVSAGFDAHRLDPIGSLGLETEDFAELTNLLLDVADAYAGGKLVSVLEGGYNVDVLGDCAAAHVEEILRREP